MYDPTTTTLSSLMQVIVDLLRMTGEEEDNAYLKSKKWLTDVFPQNPEIPECVYQQQRIENHAGDIMSDYKCLLIYTANKLLSPVNKSSIQKQSCGLALQSVFNTLNGGKQQRVFNYKNLSDGINLPSENAAGPNTQEYRKIINNLYERLKGIELSNKTLCVYIDLLEEFLSFVPHSAASEFHSDISLFDHLKISAASAVCLEQYLISKNISDYREGTLGNIDTLGKQPIFLLFSCDISGIQDFIYTVSGKNMLKALRSRSFYLEMFIEHIADELLSQTGCTRANLLYTGGGHAYMLLPNTPEVIRKLGEAENTINNWLLSKYKTTLFIAMAYTECCADSLRNLPDGSYKEVFRDVSAKISDKKLQRYSADQLNLLNADESTEHQRECRECKRSDSLTEEDLCVFCASLKDISTDLAGKDFFIISEYKTEKSLELPAVSGDSVYLIALNLEEVKQSAAFIRLYSKNKLFPEVNAKRIFMGDYSIDKDFNELAKSAAGIERIAVIRADVDNLGKAFTSGYEDSRLNILRTSVFSRMLSLFFKNYVNFILHNPQYNLDESKTRKPRDTVIVYSGGDDVFMVGGWDDCISSAIDLKTCFEKFTGDTLTISAGIGLYESSIPIAFMAKQTGDMENSAKEMDKSKNAVALFDTESVYKWEELRTKIIEDKLRTLQRFFKLEDNRGMAFVYNILRLLRSEEQINLARIAYTLARLEVPAEFSMRFYEWALNPDERAQLIKALELYAYLERRRESV